MEIFLKKLRNKENLNFEESKAAFEILMEGKASDDEIFNFLTLLSAKGESSSEIAGGVYVLRNKSKRRSNIIFQFSQACVFSALSTLI